MYELTHQRDGWASESGQYQKARGTGGRAQKFIEEEPALFRGDELYLLAFDALSSERYFGQAIGPIPWSKIVLYGEKKKLDDAMIGVFTHVLREMDEGYLKWQRNQQERRLAQSRKKK